MDTAIDSGIVNNIKQTILESEKLSETENDRISKSYIYYCISNGYASLHSLSEQPENDYIIKQLYYIRKCVDIIGRYNIEKIRNDPYLTSYYCQVFTNYGNIYEHCYRPISAIKQYKRAIGICSSFGMALGNLGIVYQYYSDLLYDDAHKYYLNYFARQYLFKGANSRDTNVFPQAREGFIKYLNSYDEEKINKFDKEQHFRKFNYNDSQELNYRNWVIKKGLFLNPLNDLPLRNLCIAADVFGLPNMRVTEKYPIYHSLFNQIKQEYIYARYLYYSTLTENNNPHYADKDVSLYNLSDYPQYSIRIEKLKTVFRVLYSIFDKVAFFLNRYFNLGINDDKVNFSKIWKNKKQGKNDKLLSPDDNSSVSSLYWIYQDFKNISGNEQNVFSPNPHLEKIKKIRHALEHRSIKIIWDWAFISEDRKDGISEYVTESQFCKYAMELLHTMRETIMCLSMCVKTEEDIRNSKDKSKITIPIVIDNYEDEWKI